MMPSPRESLDDPCDLALSGSLLLGAEDTDGLAIDGIDEWSALEQAFDRLLGSYLVEGYGGFVACGAKAQAHTQSCSLSSGR